MKGRLATALVVLVIAANAGTVLLFSGEGPISPGSSAIADAAWQPVLAFVARGLTIPIATPGIADVRDVVGPAACGIALLGLGIAGLLGRRDDPSWQAETAPATRWLALTAGPVLFIAVLSMIHNGTLDLSWGWIVRFAAGAIWAILLGRSLTAPRVRQCVAGLLLLGFVCLVLSIAHRADRHLAHFTWPIGPITSTAAFAAMWAAMAAAVALRIGKRPVVLPTAVGICVAAVYVLLQTGRRAPAVGLVGAGAFIAVVLLRERPRLRAVRIAIPLVVILGGGAYVAREYLSQDRATSGTLALRFEYWRLGAGLIGGRPSLGVGPDVSVVELTNAVTPLRAAAPHFYHGNIDPYLHNEWIQAAVELGIPGGLFYVALPVGVLVLGERQLRRSAGLARASGDNEVSPAERSANDAATLALSAGLVALLINESASIMLRTPLMPMGYWTLLGLLAAMCRVRSSPPSLTKREHPDAKKKPRASPARQDAAAPTERPPLISQLRGLGAIACGGIFLCAARLDLTHAAEQTDLATATSTPRFARLYADKTLEDRRSAALLVDRAAEQRGDPSLVLDAAKRWRELCRLVPGLHDTATRYAAAVRATGDADTARRVLEAALRSDRNPYDRDANILYATRFTDDPETKLRCVQRALRGAALVGELADLLKSIVQSKAVRTILDDESPAARKSVAGDVSPPADDCAAELIRIRAFLHYLDGRLDEAVVDQHIVASFYQSLEKTNNRFRRGHDAEADALYQLARMLYDADPAQYMEAYEAIVAAERAAILGMPHESVADPKPEDGFLIGEVVPTVAPLPERLRPLLRLSALLRVLAGDAPELDMRIMFYLPPDQWNQPAIDREMGRLARQACADMATIAENKRPPHYPQLLEMAKRYDPDGR